MIEHQNTIETCIKSVDRLRSTLKKDKSIQVRNIDEKSIIKATALAWFNHHRLLLVNVISEPSLNKIDGIFQEVLSLTDKSASRKKFDNCFKQLKADLSSLRVETINHHTQNNKVINSSDKAPSFSNLVNDADMVSILERRWNECTICVSSKAPLSATVMMGGLLESLLLTKFLQLADKKIVFKTKSCPKDKAGTPLQFKEWALRNYIDVAHELGWISQTEKDLGEVLRDYRNYIHPFKEKSHRVVMLPKDAEILWEVTKSISRQIINITP
jgi:hypothetical protein